MSVTAVSETRHVLHCRAVLSCPAVIVSAPPKTGRMPGDTANYQSIAPKTSHHQDADEARYVVGIWERLAPSVTLWIGAGTYVVCRVIAMERNTYLGGIPWPFMSDTGRDHPGYDMFVVGMCAVSITYSWSFLTLYRRRMRYWIDSALPQQVRLPVYTPLLAFIGLLFGLLAAPCLVLLSVFDVSSHPDIHNTFADLFFMGAVIAMLCWTAFFHVFRRMYPDNRLLALSTRVKTKSCVVCFAAFVVYLPVGAWVACPARRLKMDECISTHGLSESYCEGEVMRDDRSLTMLWTYRDCPGLYTMRTVAQTVCILSMLMYAVTFDLDLRSDLELLQSDEQLCSQDDPLQDGLL